MSPHKSPHNGRPGSMVGLCKPLKGMARPAGIEPATPCLEVKQASSTVFSQLLPFIALTRFWGVCFRSQRLRLVRLMGEFSDGFLTVVAAMAMLYGLLVPCCSNGFRAAIAQLVVRTRFVEPGDLFSLTPAKILSSACALSGGCATQAEPAWVNSRGDALGSCSPARANATPEGHIVVRYL